MVGIYYRLIFMMANKARKVIRETKAKLDRKARKVIRETKAKLAPRATLQ